MQDINTFILHNRQELLMYVLALVFLLSLLLPALSRWAHSTNE